MKGKVLVDDETTPQTKTMKKNKYLKEQTAFALKQAELGTPVGEVCRKMDISDATF